MLTEVGLIELEEQWLIQLQICRKLYLFEPRPLLMKLELLGRQVAVSEVLRRLSILDPIQESRLLAWTVLRNLRAVRNLLFLLIRGVRHRKQTLIIRIFTVNRASIGAVAQILIQVHLRHAELNLSLVISSIGSQILLLQLVF